MNFTYVFPRLTAATLRRLRLGALSAASASAAAAATYASFAAPHNPAQPHPHHVWPPYMFGLPLSHADAAAAASSSSTDWHSVVRALREAQRTHNLPSGFRATRRPLPHSEGARWALTIEFPVSAGADAHALLVALAGALGRGQPSRLTVDDTPTQHRTVLSGPDDLFELSLSVPRVAPLESRVSVRILRGHAPVGDAFSSDEIDALVAAYKAGNAALPPLSDASDDDDVEENGLIGILDGQASVDFGPPTKPKYPPPNKYHGHAPHASKRSHNHHGHDCDDDHGGSHSGPHVHVRGELRGDGSPSIESMRADSRRRSAMNKLDELGVEVIDGDSGLTWDVLAGYSEVKERIENTLTLPLKYPEVYERIVRGTRERAECNVPKAVLYEGPPGCGKTLSARILAATIGIPFVHVKVESILSKFYGETTRKLSEILEAADQLGRCIVFLDECDSVGMRRSGATEVHEGTRRTLSVLLRFIDGMDGAREPIVLAATNHKEDLDAAFMSRFDVVVSFPLPDMDTRVEMLRLYAKQLPEAELRELARLTWGFSGRELLDICEEAERMRAGEILRELESERGEATSEDEGRVESEAFALPTMKEYAVAVERKEMHVVGRTDERFMSASVLGEVVA